MANRNLRYSSSCASSSHPISAHLWHGPKHPLASARAPLAPLCVSYTHQSIHIIIITDLQLPGVQTPTATKPHPHTDSNQTTHKKTPLLPIKTTVLIPLAYLAQDGHQFHHSALAVGTHQVQHQIVSVLEADHHPLVPVATDAHPLDLGELQGRLLALVALVRVQFEDFVLRDEDSSLLHLTTFVDL